MESAEQMIERLIAAVEKDVYAAVVKHYEEAEHAGIIVGNGHHMAQKEARSAGIFLRERFEIAREGGNS
jgi:hypothetical protein